MNDKMSRTFIVTEEEKKLSEDITRLKREMKQAVDSYKIRIDELTEQLLDKIEDRYRKETIAEIHDVMNILDGQKINKKIRNELCSKVVDIVYHANEQKDKNLLAELKETLSNYEIG